MSDRSEKQFTVEDWLECIKASPTNCVRSIRNARMKERGGHPLSASEHNLLDADAIHEIFLLTGE
jgi:hypothetical protein